MAVEMAEIVKVDLNINLFKTQFYSDNKIVPSYISIHTKPITTTSQLWETHTTIM